ncbi:MAG: EAL domain-containing protein, partial [Janthinobacterium lividum]
MLDRAARPRPAGPDGRFVAFTFAASEMVVEVSAAGHITYASGAFRSRLGATPESFVGKPPTEMVAPCDQDAMAMALVLLQERGRLLPCIVRLANASRSAAVMAGLKLTPDNRESAVCVTFGLPPAPAALVSQATTAHRILVAAQARMPPPNQGTGRAPADPPGQLALLEITAGDRQALTTVLEEIAPHAITSELAPGRYGVLNPAGEDVSDTVLMLEAALQRRDRHVVMASRQVSLADQGLTTIQATQALRQALATFAKDGTAGTDKAGFQGGLAGYVDNAMLQAASLRRAIAQQDFSILYQPIVALDTRRLHHYEALLRPQRGMSSRSPQEFVALVETVGLADELDMA